MPLVGGTKQHVVHGLLLGLGFRFFGSDEVIPPERGHVRAHPAQVITVAVVGEIILVIGGIEIEGDAPLFAVAGAQGLLGAGLGLGQRGQEEAGEDGDDGDDHQQLDEGEGERMLATYGRGGG